MPESSIGFGHGSFGHHQYGLGDWAEEMLWKNMPEVYKDCDESGPVGSAVAQPLRKFQTALKPSYQDIRVKWLRFPSLWDAIAVPLAQLPQLGYNVGISVDSTKPEGLQRSSVLNASQLWLNKGTDKGYEITAAFEGLLVTVTPLWALTCGPAILKLGSIGATATSFDLATTVLSPRPVSPGTLHITVTTEFGVDEDIRDDTSGGLVGVGNQANGALTRLDIIGAVTLTINTIVGVFSVGDTITQGATTGTILATGITAITVLQTVGVFGVGAILDTTSSATAVVSLTSSNTLSRGETFEGLTSGATAKLRDFRPNYLLMDRVTTLAGFTPGETIRGETSGLHAVAGATTVLVAGPLQTRLDISSIIGTFVVDDEITGGTSTAVGIVRAVSASFLTVDTVTLPGFSVGETISVGASSATIDAITTGSVDYISGEMTGSTVSLLPGSQVNAVVDLVTTGPTQFIPLYDEVSADLVSMDNIQTDRYDRWPITYQPVRIIGGVMTAGECRSHSLRLYFFTPDDTEIEDFSGVTARIQLALENFRPLHVEFDKISFDGARASSQIWRTGLIVADSAAASVWTASVTGNQLATSQAWTTGPFSATVAT